MPSVPSQSPAPTPLSPPPNYSSIIPNHEPTDQQDMQQDSSQEVIITHSRPVISEDTSASSLGRIVTTFGWKVQDVTDQQPANQQPANQQPANQHPEATTLDHIGLEELEATVEPKRRQLMRELEAAGEVEWQNGTSGMTDGELEASMKADWKAYTGKQVRRCVRPRAYPSSIRIVLRLIGCRA